MLEYEKYLTAFSRRKRGQIMEYIGSIGGLSVKEFILLREWVAAGNSVFDNPCCLSDERGDPLDYIYAIRIFEEMADAAQRPVAEGLPVDERVLAPEGDEEMPF